MIHFDSLIEKIKKKENIFNLKINEVLFSDIKLTTIEKKEFLEKGLVHFRKSEDSSGCFFLLLALSEIYGDLKLSNLPFLRELEGLSKHDNYLRNFFYKNYIFTLIEEGDIDEAKKKVLSYLTFLDAKKLNERIIALVSELDKKIRLDEWPYSFWLKALGRTGDLESFNRVYSKYKKEFSTGYSSLPNWYTSIQKLWDEKGVSWRLYDEIYLNKLVIDLDKNRDKDSLLACHNLLVSIHQYFVTFGIEGDIHRYLFSQIKRKYKEFDLDFKAIKNKKASVPNDFRALGGEREVLENCAEALDILSEPSKRVQKSLSLSIDINKEFNDGERKLLGFLKKIPFEKIEKDIIDWMICFIHMKAFSILDYLIFNLEDCNRFSSLNEKNKLAYEYLVCEIYNLKEDWEKLLIRSLNILRSYDLLEREYLPIYYLRGEALFKMGRAEEAKSIFLEIHDKNPSFRIVIQRLEDIGKNK